MDKQTAMQRLYDELKRSSSHKDDTDKLTIALIRAMVWYKGTRFSFNEGRLDFQTAEDTPEYTKAANFPDLISPDNLFIDKNADGKFHPLEWIDHYDYRTRTFESGVGIAAPYEACWYRDSMFLSPVPDGIYNMQLWYVKDVGIPEYYHNSAGWSFIFEGSGWGNSNENVAWLNEAPDLILARARAIVYRTYHDDADNAAKAEQSAAAEESKLNKLLLNYRKAMKRVPTPI